jgi:hypothetical protein
MAGSHGPIFASGFSTQCPPGSVTENLSFFINSSRLKVQKKGLSSLLKGLSPKLTLNYCVTLYRLNWVSRIDLFYCGKEPQTLWIPENVVHKAHLGTKAPAVCIYPKLSSFLQPMQILSSSLVLGQSNPGERFNFSLPNVHKFLFYLMLYFITLRSRHLWWLSSESQRVCLKASQSKSLQKEQQN